MNICKRQECQTTAGCGYRGIHGEMCWHPMPWRQPTTNLNDTKDARIAALEKELATTRHYEQQWRDAEKQIAELENGDREAELDKLRHRTAVDELNITALDSRLTTITAQRDAAVKGLVFYADPQNWIDANWDDDCETPKAIPVTWQNEDGGAASICDCGDVARSVLASIPKKAPQP